MEAAALPAAAEAEAGASVSTASPATAKSKLAAAATAEAEALGEVVQHTSPTTLRAQRHNTQCSRAFHSRKPAPTKGMNRPVARLAKGPNGACNTAQPRRQRGEVTGREDKESRSLTTHESPDDWKMLLSSKQSTTHSEHTHRDVSIV